MSDNASTDIAPCFWIVSDDRNPRTRFSDSLADRLRTDGTDVEILNQSDVETSLSLSELPDASQRCQAISYLLVNLQKHGVSPILNGESDLLVEAQSANEYLEKHTLVVDQSLGEDLNLSHSIALTLDELEDELETLITHCEDRGLFNESVSDHRSDEEVTDRLKNLGYI